MDDVNTRINDLLAKTEGAEEDFNWTMKVWDKKSKPLSMFIVDTS